MLNSSKVLFLFQLGLTKITNEKVAIKKVVTAILNVSANNGRFFTNNSNLNVKEEANLEQVEKTATIR